MKTNIDRATLEELRAGLRGAAHAPSEEEYDEGRRGFNLNAKLVHGLYNAIKVMA